MEAIKTASETVYLHLKEFMKMSTILHCLRELRPGWTGKHMPACSDYVLNCVLLGCHCAHLCHYSTESESQSPMPFECPHLSST